MEQSLNDGEVNAEQSHNDTAEVEGSGGFELHLENFEGPFDLLLTLIGNRKLDVTELALSTVTGEFISYVSKLEGEGSLDKASEFIVVAATLLDLKIASLLPAGDVVDREDVALLEARDLLFARLLQYRAFKHAAKWLSGHLDAESGRHARQVKLERKFVERTPELVWTLTLDDFAALALLAMTPREIPTVGLDHLHAPLVSIREQAAEIVAQLRGAGSLSFRELIAGVASRGVIVARFLAALELYRRSAVTFEQLEPLGELTITWSGHDFADESLATLGADYD
ncbi:segregation and condensation protein A [Agrococcus casei]|uniref:Segregation and condensation protein A n=2 Tax=Agrococcus TaxID=46352 RepID=A0A1R4GJS7_9MICO|nr:Segregation and condensation protein A [Agrococcus casei LMG 22410]